MTNRIGGFIYARSDSRRLPGKPLYDIGGTRLIDIIFARAKHLNVAKNILLTTDRVIDDPLADYCQAQGYEVFRGDAFDLVKRTLQAIDAYQLDGFVRINGDCPLLEPTLVNAGLEQLNNDTGCVSNLFQRTYPYGIAVECISSVLFQRFATFALEAEREHVTSHLYRLRDRFTRISMEDAAGNHCDLRMTVDTLSDHKQMCRLSENGDISRDSYWRLCGLPPPINSFKKEYIKHGE